MELEEVTVEQQPDLTKLAALLESGALTQEQFDLAKSRLMGTTITAVTTTTTTYTFIGLPLDAALVQSSDDGASIVHRPFSDEEKALRTAHNATLPIQNVAFDPPPLQWRLDEDVEVSFDMTVAESDGPTCVWVRWTDCGGSGSDEVPKGTTRVARSFVVDRAAVVKQLTFSVEVGGYHGVNTDYTFKLLEAVYLNDLNDLSSGINLFREIPQPITLTGTSLPPGSTISVSRHDYSHLSKDEEEMEAYHDLGVRYTYEVHADAWLKILTDWDGICEATQFIRKGRGEGCVILRAPWFSRGKVTKIAFALQESDAAAFGPSWTVNVDVRKMCDVHQHFWGPRHGADRGPRPEHYEEPLEAGVVFELDKPFTWDAFDVEPGTYALSPDGSPVQNEDWRRLEKELEQVPSRTEHDPTPLGVGCSCCVLL